MRKKFGIFLGVAAGVNNSAVEGNAGTSPRKSTVCPLFSPRKGSGHKSPPGALEQEECSGAHYSPGAPLQLRCVGLKFIM